MPDENKDLTQAPSKADVLKQQLSDEVASKSYEKLKDEYGKDLKGLKDELVELKKIMALDAQQDSIDKKEIEGNTFQKFITDVDSKGYFTGVGEEGGYFITERNIPQFFEYVRDNSIVRPRSFAIPADPRKPDAKVAMLKLQQDATGAFSEGTFYPVGEGHDYTETDSKISRFTLEPKKAGAIAYISNEMRRNAPQAEAYVGTVLKRAAAKYENDKFFSGVGGMEPIGFQTSPALKSVTRDTASQIKYDDIKAMMKVAMLSEINNYVWLISQTAWDYITDMEKGTSAPSLVYKDGKLEGIPVIWTPSASAIGTANDIMLCNFQYYVTFIGTALTIDTSVDYQFKKDLYSIKAHYTVDGDTWLDRTIVQDDTSEVSPFIGLAA
jgi:HK97 family phage major capsid protein